MAESSAKTLVQEFEQYKLSIVGEGTCSKCRGIAENTFNFAEREPGVNFPPIHPMCRCTFEIIVDDWNKWLDEYEKKHSKSGNKIIKRFHQGANGNEDNNGEFIHEIIGKAENKRQRQAFINDFIQEYINAKTEHMLVIDKDGKVHHITSNSVDSIYYENIDEVFKGSYNIHNHPPNETQFTFSVDSDIPAMFADGTKVMEAFDYKYHYRFEFPNGITFEEWENEFSCVKENEFKLLIEKGINLEEYEENYLHILIEETCKQLGIKGYSRWKI